MTVMAVSDFYTARWPDFICISAHYKYDDDDDDDPVPNPGFEPYFSCKKTKVRKER